MHTPEEFIAIVQKSIESIAYPQEPAELYNPIRYELSLGGKRIRPVLTLLACELFDGDYRNALDAATGIEIFHNFTLLHDDVMDKADIRRGKPTVHVKWNENTAILSGDAMQIIAFMHMMKTPEKSRKAVCDVFLKTSLEICEGQQYDMEFESRNDVKEEEYLDMIRLKTAVLLGGALKIGALIAGASKNDADKIYKFGENIGLAFQLRDDYLDVYGDPEIFGKNIGGDILNNKKNIYAHQRLAIIRGERSRRTDKMDFEHRLRASRKNSRRNSSLQPAGHRPSLPRKNRKLLLSVLATTQLSDSRRRTNGTITGTSRQTDGT